MGGQTGTAIRPMGSQVVSQDGCVQLGPMCRLTYKIPGPYPHKYPVAAPVVRGSFAPPLVHWVPTARSPLTTEVQEDVNHILTNSHQGRIILVVVRRFGPMLVQTMRNYCPMGSTDEKRCITLTTCDSNAESQNIHAYGVMLIVSCSLPVWKSFGSVEHHYADYIKLWIYAKEAAKKWVVKLKSQISDKFSRKSFNNPDEVQILDHAEESGALYPSTSTVSHLPTDTSEALDSAEPRNKNVKKKNQKEKETHTHSQIFKYAYSWLKREKAQQQQNKNRTFSGMISMATDSETKKRPLIESAFSDLTVTLKGKHKNLMRAVTGKIKAGWIMPIMGSSGAGKTTLLSALTGKAVGFMVNGTILINRKSVSIHSYRKIIGFVPQDDIVNGNLTVEAIRGSLVGRVEKRGISGGRRKLFLYEPTLDWTAHCPSYFLEHLDEKLLRGLISVWLSIDQGAYTMIWRFKLNLKLHLSSSSSAR
ncbi:putative white-brown complex homolog protein 30 [Phtheirospermum japonicum]|uniref:Putative white-brown complex homolog protein 30 n=1 Tax=Phtheirospermum japonicum TaxID=374723 RepID=A0A830CNC9_9LAMI|nr:putative white-brown complex homolog protein 30 [Phtheirospermum japonicum]